MSPSHVISRRSHMLKRALALGSVLGVLLGPLPQPIAQAATVSGTCDVQFHSTTSAEGFTHPGIGLTEPIIQNVKAGLAAGAEPWVSGFDALKRAPAAAENATPSNAGADPTKPRTTTFNSGTRFLFENDGLKAYSQAVMHVLTGKQVYRANALAIIRNWAQMDPTQFTYYTDSHIHNGVPLFRMATAAELLRYTSCGSDPALVLTDADAQAFSNNLIRPAIATFMSSPDRFMNQHNYPLLGSMAGSIFMDDAALYREKVEWFTVNSTAKDQGFNGSISRLAWWVDKNDKTGEPIPNPHVQQVEMGRDQAHGGGDLTNFAGLARMMLSQGTKVDPVQGTVSTAANAVGPYEFLDDRVIKAADYFWQFMSGRDPEWTPVGYAISPDGTIRDTYNHIADGYRGRYSTASFWEMYYYYKYVRGVDVAKIAPFYAEAYAKRLTPQQITWDGHDGGGDSWMFAPAAAAGETAAPPNANPNILEIEQHYTRLAGDVTTGDGFVSMPGGSKIAYLSGANNNPQQGFRVRTHGAAVIHLGSVSHANTVERDTDITVPDTRGEWRYVTAKRSMGDILYVETEGATVDIDNIDINAQADLHSPTFPANAAKRIVGWKGANLEIDLAVTGPGAITYSATGLPNGATLDSATGHLSWNGENPGTITLAADDGTSVVARTIVLDTAPDRAAALAVAGKDYKPDLGYESATDAAFVAARDAAKNLRKNSTDAEYEATMAAMVAAADGLRLISPKSALDGSLDYRNVLFSSTAKERTPLLLDGDEQTGTGYPQAVNMSHIFDFGPDFRVSASKFGFQSNIFADRLANSTMYGSNDGVNWTRITPGATAFTQDYNTLDVAPEFIDTQFRYLKVQMIKQLPDVLYGIVRGVFEMTEFHIYGERHEIGNQIASAVITSPDAVAGKVSVGDTVNVAVTTKKAVQAVTVNVMGIQKAATSSDGINWLAPVALDGVAAGPVSLSVDYTDGDKAGPTLYGTTDGKNLFVGGNRAQRIDVANSATVVASSPQLATSNPLPADKVGYLLFDNDATTFTDLQAAAAYYTLDFGAGKSVQLNDLFFLPRTGQTVRADGTFVQGSNDGQTWTNLSAPLTGSKDGVWTARPVTDSTSYRYFKVTNASNWRGNMAEIQLFGTLR